MKMDFQQVFLALALCGTVCVFVIYRGSRIPKGLKLPPGPPGRFLIGNLLDLPTKENWKTFQRWAQTYGDFTYLNVLGTSLLFVNSYKLQHELFEKRGAIYSDRFQSTMLNLSGFDWSVITLQYGDLWRRHRTALHNALNKTAVIQYRGTIERHARKLLVQLDESPEIFVHHIKRTLAAFSFEMTYGYKVKEDNDSLLETAERTAEMLAVITQPGAYYVDVLPIRMPPCFTFSEAELSLVKYVPSWFPGAKFKHTAKRVHQNIQDLVHTPFNRVKELMKAGNAMPSIVSSTLENMQTQAGVVDYDDQEEEVLLKVGAIIYVTAIDTTEASFQSFLVAMILYPEVQQAAQRELDTMIGSKALPTFEDRDNLPYINALIKETLRWHPTVPCGVPHMLREDDVIGDYFIPKGTIVMGNTSALLHSAGYGENVDDFNPSRFLKGDVRDPDVAFGYGRRACPGKWVADSQLFILIASFLHVFQIEPHESEIPTSDDFISSIVSKPKPFKCRIHPRNSEAATLLQQLSHEFF